MQQTQAVGETPGTPLSPVSLKNHKREFDDVVVTNKETPRNVAVERVDRISKLNKDLVSALSERKYSTFESNNEQNRSFQNIEQMNVRLNIVPGHEEELVKSLERLMSPKPNETKWALVDQERILEIQKNR